MKMTERDFQRAVIEVAHSFGWRIAHFRTALNKRGHYQTPVAADGKGYPDLHLVHPERGVSMFRELKVGRNKPSAEQAAWGEWLTAAGCDWAVWRESDMDEIVSVLSGGRARLS